MSSEQSSSDGPVVATGWTGGRPSNRVEAAMDALKGVLAIGPDADRIRAEVALEAADAAERRLVQIVRRTGQIKRVKPENAPPVVELHLAPHERVIAIELKEDWLGVYSERKTKDWTWTAYIEARL